VAGADFNRLAMIAGVGVYQRRLRVRSLKHVVNAGEKQFGIDVEFFRIVRGELLIAFGDADELDAVAVQALLQEAFDVSVD
jgi:hypothetical protein